MTPRAIVTGGAGFIGSHVVDALLENGYSVTVIDDLSSGDASRVAEGAELRTLDVVDFAALEAVVAEVQPRAIFHLAAQASVVASVEDPGRDCEVNVRGTLNVVEAAGRCGASVVFTYTGGALYGDGAAMPTAETAIPAPLSPYGASKWAAEAYVKTWSLSSGTPHAVGALGNAYGPARARTARPVWWRSSPTTCTRAARPGSTGTASRPATTSTSAMSSPRCCPRRGGPAPTTWPRAWRRT